MDKKLLREQYETSPLTYITDPKRFKSNNAIARLEGIGGSWKKATRNDRLYSKRLWENIINSESFKEGMSTHTIFAEANHPEDRIEIDLKEVAGVLTDLDIKDDGTIFTGFDILPTPNGKLIKVLLDYGCKIGTSSRGLGDEIMKDGVNQIDPDTYEYYCHDFVVCPAVKDARLDEVKDSTKTESLEKSFSAKILEEAQNNNNVESLKNLKEIVESTNVADKTTLVETISHKLSSLSESTDEQGVVGDESEAVTDEAEQGEKNILLSSLADKDVEIEACRKKIDELKNLLSKRNDTASYFRRTIQEQCSEIEQLTTAVDDSLKSTQELSEDYELLKTQSAEEVNKLTESLNDCGRAYNQLKLKHEALKRRYTESLNADKEKTSKLSFVESKLSNNAEVIKALKNEVKTLKYKVECLNRAKKASLTESKSVLEAKDRALKESRQRLENIEETNKILQSSIEDMENRLTESIRNRKLQESVAKSVLEKYLSRTCEMYGLEVNTVKSMLPKHYNEAVIDETAKRLSERQQRFDAIPIVIPPSTGRIVEHKTGASNEAAPSFIVEALKRGAK